MLTTDLWVYLPNENFAHVADRYLKYLLKYVPDGSEIIHFCCDRYRDVSLKLEERSKRAGNQHPETVRIVRILDNHQIT